MSAHWGREEVSSYAAKVDRGGSGVAVSGHPFLCGLWKRGEGI